MIPKIVKMSEGYFRAFLDSEYLSQFDITIEDMKNHKPFTADLYDKITEHIENTSNVKFNHQDGIIDMNLFTIDDEVVFELKAIGY